MQMTFESANINIEGNNVRNPIFYWSNEHETIHQLQQQLQLQHADEMAEQEYAYATHSHTKSNPIGKSIRANKIAHDSIEFNFLIYIVQPQLSSQI